MDDTMKRAEAISAEAQSTVLAAQWVVENAERLARLGVSEFGSALVGSLDDGRVAIYVYGDNEKQKEFCRAFMREFGGKWDKSEGGSTFYFSREFDGVNVSLLANREAVCEAVVVGTRIDLVPDPNAPKIEVEREVVEWKCEPIMALSNSKEN